jgi:hypothetical protein
MEFSRYIFVEDSEMVKSENQSCFSAILQYTVNSHLSAVRDKRNCIDNTKQTFQRSSKLHSD